MKRALLILILALAVPAVRPAAAAPRYPVILVAPPGATTWGQPRDGRAPSGLYRRLLQAGYVSGRTLFVFEHPGGAGADPRSGAAPLSRLVAQARVAAGSERAQLVGYSSGGLTVCHYLKGYARDHIHTAVLAATPVGGSFLATYYRVQWEVMRQEAAFRGGFPWLSSPEIPRAARSGAFPAFPDAGSYVAARAHLVYAPLYGEYVLESRWLNLPGRQATAPSFEAWLARFRPQLFAEYLLTAAEVPSTWVAAGETSRSFYEFMALQTGRRLYLVKRTGLSDLLLHVFSDGYLPASWEDALRHYGIRLLEVLGGHLLHAGRAALTSTFLEGMGELAGFSPEGPALHQVLQTTVPLTGVPRSDGAPGRVSVPVNAGLQRWHQWRREGGGPRLVVLGSRLPNLWQPLIPTAGPNDLAVEVEAMLPPPGPEDTIRIWTGTWGPNHLTLLGRADVQEFIVRELTRRVEPARTHRPLAARTPAETWSWQEAGRVRVSSWHPTQIRITSERLAGVRGELVVEFQLPELPAGWDWLLGGGDRQMSAGAGRVRFPLGVMDNEAVVGVRPAPREGTAGLSSELVKDVSYQVRFTVDSVADAASPPPVPRPDPIRVVRTTKRTTQRHAARTYHQRWIWDLGDGTLLESDDPERTSMLVEHRYARPGSYTVQATAYDNHGRVIRHLTWEHQVEGTDTHRFFAQSIVEPEVSVTVKGPRTWVTGRPAVFRVAVQVSEVPGVHREVVSIDPAPSFEVWWERPGRFTVQAAATVRITYEFPERRVTVHNTYVGSVSVEVLAPVITD
ncbi:MAG TPA: hypothetical protein DCM14_02065 [Clostridiales bacterium UBA8153]|nr:hypothetical protein [Clostridiales bacterium UBA8153]